MSELLKKHVSAFLKFAKTFEYGSIEDQDNIRLKIDHTMRVLGIAQRISASLDLTKTEREAACLAALYHDTGRFPQYARYKTYKDGKSENHALLGVRTISQNGFLADVPETIRRLVYGAVSLHNKKDLPPLSPHMGAVCHIVRDSDKLDIMHVLLEHLDQERVSPVVVMGAAPHPEKYTKQLLSDVCNQRTGDYSLVHWTNDCRLLMASWAFSLNFPESYSILDEKDYLGQIFKGLPDDTECRNFKKMVTNYARSCL